MSEFTPELPKDLIKEFYRERARKFDPSMPEVSMLLQDKTPNLATERSTYEITTISPLIVSSNVIRVLDVGCGVGRWGVALKTIVSSYIGTDFCEPLLAIAKKQLFELPECTFKKMEAQDERHVTLGVDSNLILFTGVAHYLSNLELMETLKNFLTILRNTKGTLYLRCPTSNFETFSLLNHWSDELQDFYSAKYRSVSELELYFEKIGYLEYAEVVSSGSLYPDHLQNRKETRQWYWVWKFN
jgi:SAM-dependent methyltransferase